MLAGVNKKGMAALSSGHLATDLAQGSLPVLLPVLVEKFGLSYTMAAALVLASTFASSIIQPVFGHWSDARGALWLLPAGTALAAVGMALATAAPSYPLALLAVMASGLGVAAFHPEASKFASYVSGRRRASGMSFFSVGGNVGFSLGPLVYGFGGVALLVAPGLAVAVALVAVLPYLARFAPSLEHQAAVADRPSNPRALKLLLGVVGLRSVAHMGLFAFVPLYELSRGGSKAHATLLLSLFLFAGAIGTLFGGPLADRFGRRTTLIWSFAVATPLIVVYVLAGGVMGEIALILSGAALIGTFGITIVMSQEYMPARVGMASGLAIGLAIGLGGVAATALGALADAVDLKTAVLATASGPVLSLILTLLLPPSRRSRVIEPGPAPVTV